MSDAPVAVITGAAGGIGGGLVAAFRAAGYAVIAADRAASDDVRAVDITDTAAVNAFAAGLSRVDLLVNAAGVLNRQAEFDPETFQKTLDVNLTGTLRLCTAFRDHLARSRGSIINVASMYAIFGAPHAPGYAASKGGVAQLTKSLAVAWAKDGIRVNAIAPGWIETAMTVVARSDDTRNRAILERTPMGRWGTPQDVAGPVLFLASDAARFVTGVVLPVDGGYSIA